MSTNHEKMAGIIHCIIWFICACCALAVTVDRVRPLEMRCCSHIAAKTNATSQIGPFSRRSRKKKFVESGIADCTTLKS
jgi:hypothetical protein